MLNTDINDVALTELYDANEYIKTADTNLYDGIDCFI